MISDKQFSRSIFSGMARLFFLFAFLLTLLIWVAAKCDAQSTSYILSGPTMHSSLPAYGDGTFSIAPAVTSSSVRTVILGDQSVGGYFLISPTNNIVTIPANSTAKITVDYVSPQNYSGPITLTVEDVTDGHNIPYGNQSITQAPNNKITEWYYPVTAPNGYNGEIPLNVTAAVGSPITTANTLTAIFRPSSPLNPKTLAQGCLSYRIDGKNPQGDMTVASKFTNGYPQDCTVWYNLNGVMTQIDCEVEQANSVAWIISFKAQAAIASGAIDNNYYIVTGNTAPTVKSVLANIWAGYDDFTGSTLNVGTASSTWATTAAAGQLTIANNTAILSFNAAYNQGIYWRYPGSATATITPMDFQVDTMSNVAWGSDGPILEAESSGLAYLSSAAALNYNYAAAGSGAGFQQFGNVAGGSIQNCVSPHPAANAWRAMRFKVINPNDFNTWSGMAYQSNLFVPFLMTSGANTATTPIPGQSTTINDQYYAGLFAPMTTGIVYTYANFRARIPVASEPTISTYTWRTPVLDDSVIASAVNPAFEHIIDVTTDPNIYLYTSVPAHLVGGNSSADIASLANIVAFAGHSFGYMQGLPCTFYFPSGQYMFSNGSPLSLDISNKNQSFLGDGDTSILTYGSQGNATSFSAATTALSINALTNMEFANLTFRCDDPVIDPTWNYSKLSTYDRGAPSFINNFVAGNNIAFKDVRFSFGFGNGFSFIGQNQGAGHIRSSHVDIEDCTFDGSTCPDVALTIAGVDSLMVDRNYIRRQYGRTNIYNDSNVTIDGNQLILIGGMTQAGKYNNFEGGPGLDLSYDAHINVTRNQFSVEGMPDIYNGWGEMVLVQDDGGAPSDYRFFADTGNITNISSTTLTDTTKTWAVTNNSIPCSQTKGWNDASQLYVEMITGAARGQYRAITDHSATSVTFATPFNPAPANGDKYSIAAIVLYDMDMSYNQGFNSHYALSLENTVKVNIHNNQFIDCGFGIYDLAVSYAVGAAQTGSGPEHLPVLQTSIHDNYLSNPRGRNYASVQMVGSLSGIAIPGLGSLFDGNSVYANRIDATPTNRLGYAAVNVYGGPPQGNGLNGQINTDGIFYGASNGTSNTGFTGNPFAFGDAFPGMNPTTVGIPSTVGAQPLIPLLQSHQINRGR